LVDCVNDIEVEDVNCSRLLFTWIKSPSKPETRFSNFIADKNEFTNVVKRDWKCDCKGYNMYKLVKKIKNMKVPLNKLAWKNGNLFQNVKKLEDELKKAQVDVKANPNNIEIKKKMSRILHHYNEAITDEEKLLAQKARSNNGETDQIDSSDGLFSNKLSKNEAEFMVRDISDVEVKEAIFGIGDDKAPGPDGFTAGLLKGYNRKIGPQRCALKIDIAKAYDTHSLYVNDERYGYFKSGRGLRQGDPMSPYLFTLVMEVLTLIVQRRVNRSN
ncbi:hypothetical protein Tco_1000709, partial [Tanacetum coccineum]